MFNMILQLEIDKAVVILKAGGLVAIPTETVYGLGADARNPLAVDKIFTAKQRPASHPLIVHLATSADMSHWAREIPKSALQLAEAFWPGPLTLILKKRPEVLDGVTGGQDTIALRMPRHPVALALLQAFGGGLVAPSANRFTRVSPTTAEAVHAELGDQVDLILDGGPCEVGLESTILDLSSDTPRILRPGMISPAQIASVLRIEISVQRQDYPAEIRVPGMHHLHYSPVTPTTWLTSTSNLQTLTTNELPAVVLTHSPLDLSAYSAITAITMPNNPDEYAHELYASLRAQDHQQYKRILIEAVPDEIEWDAIRDRLMKACGNTNQ
jgi:L-threonylcarbamoyladenylate synthase